MARLRVFVSSTCYDLDILRSELRPFISSMGYEPVMSDYSDILFDPRSHTHDSCLKEVSGCDVVVLIIGSRFGGTAVPSALANIDFSQIEKLSTKTNALEVKDRLSITQIEVLKAIEQSIPVYTFVDERVLHDHHVYEKNKDKKEIIENIEFPSIQKKETAKYIFEFINFISHRVVNNGLTGFTRLDEIRSHLVNQWSLLFQRLLLENKTQSIEARRYRDFSERIEDLKAVVLASLATPGLRETAKSAVQFRQLISFVSALKFVDHKSLLLSNISWEKLLESARIKDVKKIPREKPYIGPGIYLVLDDKTFYQVRYPYSIFERTQVDWSNFTSLDPKVREAIVEALLEDRETRRFSMIRYVEQNIDQYLESLNSQDDESLV